jgi:hypothetical protein
LQECYSYSLSAWTAASALLLPTAFSAMTSSPYADSILFVTGGEKTGTVFGMEKTGFVAANSEVLWTNTTWKNSLPALSKLTRHCMVKINSTTVMVIGGTSNNNNYLKLTYFLNTNSNPIQWVSGPLLATGRKGN